MRVEQRIGRIDRIGQLNPTVEIVNYYDESTVEADIQRALRPRINIFDVVVGPLQPILATRGNIRREHLSGNNRRRSQRRLIVPNVQE